MKIRTKLFSMFIVAAFFMAPIAANAITLSELVNLFVALNIIPVEKQALALQLVAEKDSTSTVVSTPPTSVVGTTESCPNLSNNLYRGMRGDDVSKLQGHLTSTGYYTYGTITGYYGLATEAAVKRWQSNHGLVSSGDASSTGYGVVGPRTRAQLSLCSQLGPGYTATPLPIVTPTAPTTPTLDKVSTDLSSGTSCVTPWGNRTVKSGDIVSSQPYFTNGVASGTIVVPLMRCNNSVWTKCDWYGNDCKPYTEPSVPQVVSPAEPIYSLQSCIFGGQTFASGQLVNAYKDSSVSYGSQCVSQVRSCTDGALSGSYQYSLCVVDSAPQVTSSSTNGASCVTPWGNKTAADGVAVPGQPYFSGGVYTLTAVDRRYVCQSGAWISEGFCNVDGLTCVRL